MSKTIKEKVQIIFKTVKTSQKNDAVLVANYWKRYQKNVPDLLKTSPETICRAGRKLRNEK